MVANQILAEMQSADKNLTVGAMTAAQSRSNLSTEHFTVTTGYINPIFHICNSANEFFPTIDILDFVKENKNNKKINYKTGIFLIVIGILSLGVKQISIIRNAPQIIYNLVQLMIKLPSGLGICFCIISINKKIFLKPLSMVGKIAYELYLVHGYILENVNASINGYSICILLQIT